VAEEQRKSPRKRRPRSASGAEKPAKQKSDYGNDGGDTEERGRSGKGPGDDGPGDDDGRQRGPGNPDADPVRIHREYIERHVGGGEGQTADRHARSVEQWNELPGAIRRPPTEIRPEAESPDDSEQDEGPTGGEAT
jgi:hypothetical protein